jgi:NitT/TauT family transport system ATP-binding protein
VELVGVSKTFGDGDAAVQALDAVDLAVESGEFVSLIGPSGSGKSTLLRLVADLTPPSHGEVRVEGRPPGEARLARRSGMVFQEPVLMDWRSVRENVELPLEIGAAGGADRRARADQLLDLMGLADFGDRWPWELSGGMQQRVAIARALATEPALLLMDEPFGALDEMTRERLNALLAGVTARLGTTVLFVTHSIAEAVFLSDRIVVLSARPGRIEAVIRVDLPRPRDPEARTAPRYFSLITEVRAALREGIDGEGSS